MKPEYGVIAMLAFLGGCVVGFESAAGLAVSHRLPGLAEYTSAAPAGTTHVWQVGVVEAPPEPEQEKKGMLSFEEMSRQVERDNKEFMAWDDFITDRKLACEQFLKETDPINCVAPTRVRDAVLRELIRRVAQLEEETGTPHYDEAARRNPAYFELKPTNKGIK